MSLVGCAAEIAQAQCQAQAAQYVTEGVAKVTEKGLVKLFDRVCTGVGGRRFDFLYQIGVAAYGTLPEHHQAAGKNVGPFHRNADGERLVYPGQKIPRADNHAASGHHVHGIVHHVAHQLGVAVFQQRRGNGRFNAAVQHGGGEAPRGVHHVGVAGDGFQRFLHPFKLRNGAAELLPNGGVGTGGQAAMFARACTQCGQGNRAPHRQAFQQHDPTLSDSLLTTNDLLHGDKHVFAPGGPVHKSLVHGQVPITLMDAVGVAGNQYAGDTHGVVRPQ